MAQRTSTLSVLFLGPELTPLAKAGGLGDVLGALPPALYSLGVDARVVLPFYGSIPHSRSIHRLASYEVLFGGRRARVHVFLTTSLKPPFRFISFNTVGLTAPPSTSMDEKFWIGNAASTRGMLRTSSVLLFSAVPHWICFPQFDGSPRFCTGTIGFLDSFPSGLKPQNAAIHFFPPCGRF